jgi:N-methylhydantoinase B
MPDPIRLEIFKHLFASVAEEMGVTLQRTAYSPNIKERLDYSCALFTSDGRLLAQAAHIPVHLGAMPASVRAALQRCAPFAPGDLVILNDPYLGGTHLPDITLVSPVFLPSRILPASQSPITNYQLPSSSPPHFFVASRAHHADVGGMSPGSMPLSTEIYQEGLIIPPLKLVEAGRRNEAVWDLILNNVRTPGERQGDLAAQMAAHAIGARRVGEIVAGYGLAQTQEYGEALIAYTERIMRALIASLPPGRYAFTDYLEGADGNDWPVCVAVTVSGDTLAADFSGTAPAVAGNLNAVPAIVESAAAYVLRCLAGADAPMNAGAFAPLTVRVPAGSLLDARRPHAVAAGNVETSQRIVDVLFGALAQARPGAVPAASQGTMNNLTFGGRQPGSGQPFAYYETMGGGVGAGPQAVTAASGVHAHMSNTRNTPVEALEHALPVRVERYALRRGSGGGGRHRGGDGLRRDLRFLVAVTVTVLSERRRRAPWGLAGGQPGTPGRNLLLRGEAEQEMPGKFTLELQPGDGLSIQTPGGGGWGEER